MVAIDTGHDVKRELVAINGKGQWTIHKDAIALSTAFTGLKRLIPLSEKIINWPAIGLTVLIATAMAYVFEALKLPRFLRFVNAFCHVFYMSDTIFKGLM